jgi:GT2 family glycosyltransferase
LEKFGGLHAYSLWVRYELDLCQATTLIAEVDVHPSRRGNILHESEFRTTPSIPVETFTDHFGNMCRRLTARSAPLALQLHYDNGGQDGVYWTAEATPAPEQHLARKRSGWSRRGCVVAIPVKDEAERLPGCLRALAQQQDGFGRPLVRDSFGVLIFANNCSDQSASLARSLAESLPFPVRIVETRLPSTKAHAGGARRAAMNLAGAWLERDRQSGSVILTTDADSQVCQDWISKNLTAIDAGADAVLGRIVLDSEGDLLPQFLHRRGRLESAYEALLTELSALLDPLDHNPWPHHSTISGASLAVTRDMYRQVGGLPSVPLGEDKAFVAALLRHDARIRFCPELQVITSGRLDGRAPGGVADTLRLRSVDPDAFCDGALEPFRVAMRRARWRGRLRRSYQHGGLAVDGEWARDLGVSAHHAQRIATASAFGAAWSAIESTSPLFERRLLTPADLPGQILGARRALDRLQKSALPDQHVETKGAVPIPPHNARRLVHKIDEELGGLVAG